MKLVAIKGIGSRAEFRLHDGFNTVGRDISNRIRLLDPKVSRRHCKIRKVGRSLFLYDLGTKNGTVVNDETVTVRELRIGDRIKVGTTVLQVVDDDFEFRKMAKGSIPASFFRMITTTVFRRRPRVEAKAYPLFPRKSMRAIWRPSVDTDPPEGRRETIVSSDHD